ncbi:MAG: ATP-binding cassette domain-containing protein [Patescibacteria group bacterium]|nr:ATP-binding cassette domain-containing protein [Patescibacteria group bacterium]
MIEFKQINKSYSDGLVLSDINLTVNDGEFITFVGRSGVGKTTIFRLLIGEEKPDSGELIVNGCNVEKLTKSRIPYYRRKLGVVFQDFKLLSRKTVYENVAFTLVVSGASNKKIKELVPQAIGLVGLSGKENRFPHELSGGEQQRCAIARAIVHQPKILIADELTGDLDAIYSWEIMEILLRINKLGNTVLIATHDRDIVNRLNKRVITMENGKVAKDQAVGRYMI